MALARRGRAGQDSGKPLLVLCLWPEQPQRKVGAVKEEREGEMEVSETVVSELKSTSLSPAPPPPPSPR